MYNKKTTILVADVNEGNVVELDSTMVITSKSGDLVFYPSELQIVNSCGAAVGFNLINNEIEYAEFEKNPQNFEFNEIPRNVILNRELDCKVYKLLIKGLENTATIDLKVEFIDYKI